MPEAVNEADKDKVTSRAILIVFCCSMVLLFSMGMRQSFGLFQSPISQAFGVGISAFSFSLALQNLIGHR